MKKFISLLLVIIAAVSCFSLAAFADYDMSEDAPTYVTVYGLDQPYTDRIWAVTSQGYIEHIQVWDGGKCISGASGNHIMQPNHRYEINIKVVGVTGDIYINSVSCWHAKSYGVHGSTDRWVVGEYNFSTPEYFGYCPAWNCWGWYNPWFSYAPMWGWRCY